MKRLVAVLVLLLLASSASASPACVGCNVVAEGVLASLMPGDRVQTIAGEATVVRVDLARRRLLLQFAWDDHQEWRSANEVYSRQSYAERLVIDGVGGALTPGSFLDEGPLLPWPPYAPNASGDVSGNFPAAATYGDLAQRIADKLDQRDYATLKYYSIVGGFAIMTRPERCFPAERSTRSIDGGWVRSGPKG